ncbi:MULTISPECIES: FecCD family ABC transporter permease [Brevibacillus]|jgi:iron complex transport system permease protein|uniref:FecCD family ABC transporter permease n=1 Tax=Brevibacillus TaxID=55080 RepID=UPI0004681659|nr:iron ABC transporter permease [Brevibacillus borstelensis]KKX53338.1 iron ABC transporter permease [Brevibacillus borstelensis cifa_chp40]MCM3560741.1 iron ABC transporter permease [Brevibacillus borstelensis]MED1745128.1 iron ABC transporter permease [Brevibacillus borstelensis]MED1853994.1 iron ABC transporter permease [Brevibacillus borstelensis]MED1885340.1 iron ABC transporter permease [Brevibacillus borstelensis]
MKGYLTLRPGKRLSSFHLHRKSIWVTVAAAIATLAVAVISLGMGEMKVSPLDVLKVLIGMGDEQNTLLVQQFRMPRVVVGMLVGASLAGAGAIMQGVVRNPLAAPDILGVSGGASVAAVAFLLFFETVSIKWLPPVAFLGATLIMFLLYALAWKKGVTPLRLVLIGVGIKIAASAVVTMLIMFSPFLLQNKAILWLTGSIYGVSWADARMILPWTIGLLLLAALMARRVNIQQLGDDISMSVGSTVQRDRFFLLLICAALTGTAVSVGGEIGFVALLAPHIAKQLIGPSFGSALPLSAFIGALIVLIADLIARMAFTPIDVPVGVFTSAVGAPFFIYLLYRNRNR